MRIPRFLPLAIFVLVLGAGAPPAFAQQSGYYVLDGFGGVHAGGGAPAISPQTPYFGFDIAKDIVYVPPNPAFASTKDGVLVLDGYGGVYTGGGIHGTSLAPPTPYFGFNVARAIALRDAAPPRAARYVNAGTLTVSVQISYTNAGSVSIVAPRSGMLIFTATAEVFCENFNSAGSAVARMAVGIDSTSPALGVDYPIGIADCALDTGSVSIERTIHITAPFPVSAGTHTLYLLARRDGGTQNPVISDRLLSVMFVD